jgi:transcriptional regulator with XRE-family HTH domain
MLVLANQSPQNIIGATLKRLRRALKLSQAMVAARCTILGWDISQNTITKIESGFRCVTDYELVTLARALRVGVGELLPEKFDIQGYLGNRVSDKNGRTEEEVAPPFSEQEN